MSGAGAVARVAAVSGTGAPGTGSDGERGGAPGTGSDGEVSGAESASIGHGGATVSGSRPAELGRDRSGEQGRS